MLPICGIFFIILSNNDTSPNLVSNEKFGYIKYSSMTPHVESLQECVEGDITNQVLMVNVMFVEDDVKVVGVKEDSGQGRFFRTCCSSSVRPCHTMSSTALT